jgi:hypothetical protein
MNGWPIRPSVFIGVYPRFTSAVVLLVSLLGSSHPASTALLWHWSYSGAGVSASGTFTTDEAPDTQGFHRITGIAGTANGGTITGLQPTGTAIPGNAGYPVDNLIRRTSPQLTGYGFGFSVSNGEYHNPFYLEEYRDYVSRPPHHDGGGDEPAVRFTATPAPDHTESAGRRTKGA